MYLLCDVKLKNSMEEMNNPIQQAYADTCAIKSQQLILNEFGIDVTEDMCVQYSIEKGWYTCDGSGTQMFDVGNILVDAGIPCTQRLDANIFDIVNELAQGHKIIVGVDSSELHDNPLFSWMEDSQAGQMADHALIVSGIDMTDPVNPTVILTDPGTGISADPIPLKQFMDAWNDSSNFMVSTDIPTPAAVEAFEQNGMMDYHLPDIAGVDYSIFNQFTQYSHFIEPIDYIDLYDAYTMYPTMPTWTFDSALTYFELPPVDPAFFVPYTPFDPYVFDYSTIAFDPYMPTYSPVEDNVLVQQSIDNLTELHDSAMEHYQNCIDNGEYVTAQMWLNEAHNIEATLNDIIS